MILVVVMVTVMLSTIVKTLKMRATIIGVVFVILIFTTIKSLN